MSTSDSSLLAGASAVTENLIPLITGKKLEGKKAVWATRIMVIVNAAIGLAIALWAQTIYELSIVAWTLLLVGLFTPFALGMYWKKANSWGAMTAFIGGFMVWIAGYNLSSSRPVLVANPLRRFANTPRIWVCIAMPGGAASGMRFTSVPLWRSSLAILLMIVVSLATQKISPPRNWWITTANRWISVGN